MNGGTAAVFDRWMKFALRANEVTLLWSMPEAYEVFALQILGAARRGPTFN